MEKNQLILSVKDLNIQFNLRGKALHAIRGIDLDIYHGEVLAIVGESGSGKSTIGRSIIRLYDPTAGKITFDGQDISGRLSHAQNNTLRTQMQMIFQDPMASLNERAKVDYIVSEGLQNVRKDLSKEERSKMVEQALLDVGLLPEFASRFPHEFSGGQRQRIGIARALIMEPEFIIADEPISALDVSIRAQVINLLNRLKAEKGFTYMFIAHDLSVVRFISDRIAVMYKGRIVELAESEELFLNPLHPYTNALLQAAPVPDPDIERGKKLVVYNPAMHDYATDKPAWTEIKKGHFVWANGREADEYRKILK